MRDRLGVNSAPEHGVGLIEIVVAMLLFGLLAMSFLPLLIMAVKASATNARIATASQLAGQQLELIRAQGSDCASIEALNGAQPTTTDEQTVVYQPELIVGACPASFPGVISVEARVWNTTIGSPDGPLATATTLVRVLAAGP
ncbi:MAG: hypothetical protein WED09_11575 [Homoserinimonas sp.]